MTTCIKTLGLLAITAALSFGEGAPKEKGKKDPDKMFKKLDSDSSGSISLEEFKQSPPAQKNPDKAEAIYAKMDADGKDGVSLEEFKAFKPGKGKGEGKGKGKKKGGAAPE